jgi:hypothetical protein
MTQLLMQSTPWWSLVTMRRWKKNDHFWLPFYSMGRGELLAQSRRQEFPLQKGKVKDGQRIYLQISGTRLLGTGQLDLTELVWTGQSLPGVRDVWVDIFHEREQMAGKVRVVVSYTPHDRSPTIRLHWSPLRDTIPTPIRVGPSSQQLPLWITRGRTKSPDGSMDGNVCHKYFSSLSKLLLDFTNGAMAVDRVVQSKVLRSIHCLR